MRSMTSETSGTCEPERIDRPTTWALSSTAARTICAGVTEKSLVDDLHAAVAGAHGDLLGAVRGGRGPVSTRNLSLRPSLAESCSTAWRTSSRPWPPRSTAACAIPVGARYSPNTRLSIMPFARRSRRPRTAPSRCAPPWRQPRARPVPSRAARQISRPICSACEGNNKMVPSPAVSGEASVSVQRLTPTTICSPLSMLERRASCCSRPGGASCSPMAGIAPPNVSRVLSSAFACSLSSPTLRAISTEAAEDVAVIEEIGLVGDDLLRHPERPLLVPRAVAGRARPGAARRVPFSKASAASISSRMR